MEEWKKSGVLLIPKEKTKRGKHCSKTKDSRIYILFYIIVIKAI